MSIERPFVRYLGSPKHLKSTIINEIAVEVSLFTAVATAICLVDTFRTSLAISSEMLTVVGTVLGLVVSFRTTSAYERYGEGRKLWSSIILASRNLAQIIWIHVPIDGNKSKNNTDETGETDEDSLAKLNMILEKKSMINLVQAFSVSVKHALRGEPSVFYQDLYPLVSFLPLYAYAPDIDFQRKEDNLALWHASQDTLQALNKRAKFLFEHSKDPVVQVSINQGTGEIDIEKIAADRCLSQDVLLLAQNPPKESLYHYLPILLIFKPVVTGIRGIFRGQQQDTGGNWINKETETNRDPLGKKIKPTSPLKLVNDVPLEICLFLNSYLASLLKRDLLQSTIAGAFVNNLASLQESVTSLERVRTSPIPFAYQMHLRLTIWLFLIFLPFQIIGVLGWVTIPATAFASFLYLGFLEIGSEIEDPFQYDANDLELDNFCNIVSRRLAEITAHPVSMDPADYVFSERNKPFVPQDERSAQDIVHDTRHEFHKKQGMHHIQRMLLKAWKEHKDHVDKPEKTKKAE